MQVGVNSVVYRDLLNGSEKQFILSDVVLSSWEHSITVFFWKGGNTPVLIVTAVIVFVIFFFR